MFLRAQIVRSIHRPIKDTIGGSIVGKDSVEHPRWVRPPGLSFGEADIAIAVGFPEQDPIRMPSLPP
ncbi:hypothetical protein A0H81_02067 [Grifola frondosa]|uniref:Uncharacterized protein n=1 Tax=Grifola frondosa TaxID=5627 RepID=A0A1C7MK96_GRIFR|nr:hypothetical protein A0H81_02067 [Grifola frondosa]